MDGSQNNYWGQPNLNRVCFGLDMDHSMRELQRQQTAKEYNSNVSHSQPPFYSDSYRLTPDNALLPSEGDQVVPFSQRCAAFKCSRKGAKPLPPLPVPEELMSDEAADSEVEFFTSDRRCLLPKSCPKPITRGGNKDPGKVNYAYQESSVEDGAAGIGCTAFSWPSRDDRQADRGGRFGANNWFFSLQRDNNQCAASAAVDSFGSKLMEQEPSSRERFPCLGVPSQTHDSSTACSSEKPQIPPRIPIPPKPPGLSKSANEEDKPPKIPPRVPLVPPCPPRAPSPKSLPIYINGVMPVTQSFAANPNYVSKALQRQQHERRAASSELSPCIVPILKDGKQASATHYILLPPGSQAHAQRRGRILSEPNRTGSSSVRQRR
ncbi:ERBB receptor feedback inhibitor 1 [Cololabis saira]|uniref:ERBB receptor feedback inhibitor 1 n=1 Tax=Cololabis saira TaxID=129043 RepID=UPI002AD33FA9|nr:ERBB receptor feedback inhibitor 1 [Cololabis saira]